MTLLILCVIYLFRPACISCRSSLCPDHTRNGVKCDTKTFYPAWFTPSLA